MAMKIKTKENYKAPGFMQKKSEKKVFSSLLQ
jgi:hypothetical protein